MVSSRVSTVYNCAEIGHTKRSENVGTADKTLSDIISLYICRLVTCMPLNGITVMKE
jgi:hypothetical protein